MAPQPELRHLLCAGGTAGFSPRADRESPPPPCRSPSDFGRTCQREEFFWKRPCRRHSSSVRSFGWLSERGTWVPWFLGVSPLLKS